MPDNPPHNALRAVVDRCAEAYGSVVEIPARRLMLALVDGAETQEADLQLQRAMRELHERANADRRGRG